MLQNQAISHNILIVEKYLKYFLKKHLYKYDLNAAEGMVLLMLYHGEQKGSHEEGICKGQTQDGMIHKLHYDKGVMARTMQTLEIKNYIKREKHPTDNRSYLFYLTEKGISFMPHLFDILMEWNDLLVDGIDPDALKTTDTVLRSMVENIMKQTDI